MDKAALWGARLMHLNLINGFTEEQADIIFNYLADNFSGKQIPELPEDWIARWTFY